MENKKKSTYNAKAQKKYNSRNRMIACKVAKERAEEIEKFANSKGFKSFNSYIIHLINEDMKK